MWSICGKNRGKKSRATVPLTVSCSWAILGGLSGPSGAQPILPKPNLVGAYPDTWLSFLGSQAWRCGTHVHTFSKHSQITLCIVQPKITVTVQILLFFFLFWLKIIIFILVKNKRHFELQ